MLLLLGAGTYLRVHDVLDLPLDGDEFYSLEEATTALKQRRQTSWGERWRVRWVTQTHPLTQALNEWSVERWGPEIASLRRLPCLAGLLSLLVFPWYFARIAGSRAGLVLLALLAFCPLHVQFSRFARYQSGAFFFGGLFILATAAWLQRGKLRDLAVALPAAVLCTGAHLSGLLLVLPVMLYASLVGRHRKLKLAVVGALLVAGALSQRRRLVKAWVVVRDVLSRPQLVTGATRLVASVAYTVGPLLSLAALTEAIRSVRRRDRVMGLIAVAAGAPLLLLVVLSFFEDAGVRYYSCGVLALLLLAARLLAGRRDSPPRTGRVVALTTLVCLANAPLLISDQIDGHRFDFEEAGRRLARHATPRHVVLSKWHGILQRTLGFEPIELQYDADWVRAICLESMEDEAYLVLMAQRGDVVFPDPDGEFRPWLEEYGRLVERVGQPRLDSALYSFELRIYAVDVERLARDRGLDPPP